MTEYSWRCIPENGRKLWVLLPTNEPNDYSMRRIASYIYNPDTRRYVASYHYEGTGNKSGSWAFLATRKNAQTWVERQLLKFWEPPLIA
jgi:hypothetical protein